MSDSILKALMRLFALISIPGSDENERRKIVQLFLRKQLNKQLTLKYVNIYKDYYNQYQEKYKDQQKLHKSISSSSVKLLVVCEQINAELTQRQKFSLMLMLINFVMSGNNEAGGASIIEKEFVEAVAHHFKFEKGEFLKPLEFMKLPIEHIPKSSNLLLINSQKEKPEDCKHIHRDGIEEQLAVLHVPSVDMYICRYHGSRDLYLNSQMMSADDVYVLNYGCSIRNPQIKPVYYSDIVNCFYHATRTETLLFEAKDVEYEFESGHLGLHSMNFEAISGNIVGILGGSGAGKSTLMNVLTGVNKPTKGKVLLNNVDIHTQHQEIEGIIGYVSQDDLLIEELTVFQNLYFNAKLCFGQYSDNEILQKTDDVLHDLNLNEIRDLKVGSVLNKKISGGQRKRLNIALELIRQPAVLFLDEPTSGLSSRDSDNIMDLLKELSLKGKLLFVVIHQPSSDIFKMFDKLLVLDKGGYMIYHGNPVDAILYFKSQAQMANCDTCECHECGNINPEQIFNIVESRVLDEFGNLTETRRISPAEWHETFINNRQETIPEEIRPKKPPSTSNIKRPSHFKQFLIYSIRNLFTKAGDLQFVTISLFLSPLLALLLSYIIRYYKVSGGSYIFEFNENLPIYIFVAVIIAMFIGLSISAEEIIKDRKILKRETFLHLSRGSYLFSKAIVLFGISAIQALLFVIVGNSVTGILGQTFTYWLVLFSAWCSANLIGLIISDSFKSVVTIYILIPLIVIPQLMLSGSLLSFDKINPDIAKPSSVPWYGELITTRWAFEALAVEQFTNNEYGKIMYQFDKSISVANYKRNYWIVEMRNKLEALKKSENNPSQDLLTLLSNEIDRENKRQNHIHYSFREELKSNGVTQKLIDETSEYLNQLSLYYTALNNQISMQKDKLINEIAEKNPDSLLSLKSRYHNQELSNLVKKNNEQFRIIEYKNRFLQNFNQIYNDPEHPFIIASFYAPQKNIFGSSFPTLWVNLWVIWFFNIFFFIALYFRWLPILMEIFEKKKK